MNHTLQIETNMERHLLGVIALLCYGATLALMLVLSYALVTHALDDFGRQLAVMYSASGV